MNHLLFLGLVIGALSIVGAVASMSRNFHPFDKAAVLPLRGILALLVAVGHCFLMMDLRGYSLERPPSPFSSLFPVMA